MPVSAEHMLRDIREELREIIKLRVSVEALISVVGDTRDATIKNTHAMEQLTLAIDRLEKRSR